MQVESRGPSKNFRGVQKYIMFTHILKTGLVCLVLLALTGAIALAQVGSGTISGIVTDESGAVIPNATVTITNKATGIARTATTNAEGFFSAPAMQAGDYDVRAEMQGVQDRWSARLRLQAGESTQVNMPMTLGRDQRSGDGRSCLGADQLRKPIRSQGVIPRSTIQDLPLNGRSYMQLAALEPGVTIGTGQRGAVQRSVHGQRPGRGQPHGGAPSMAATSLTTSTWAAACRP